MKGESRPMRRSRMSRADDEALAAEVFGRIAADEERLGRFLALSGLDPRSLRSAASSPDFLPAILDYVTQDETLLLAVADEIDVNPTIIAEASRRLSGPQDQSDD